MRMTDNDYEKELSCLGVPGFRPGQREVIDRVMAGRNTLALMPTGAGKSLCYQLPAMKLPGTALIVSPLLALMREQVDGIEAKGIEVARWDSTLSVEEKSALRARLVAGVIKMLYVSPESLRGEEMGEILGLVSWSVLVIDEAHCLSEWGQRFRPEYLLLPSLARLLGRPVLALTATATPPVVEELVQAFEIESGDIIRLSVRKDNIVREVIPVTAAEKTGVLIEYLERENHQPALVYVNRREDAETVAASLLRRGIQARAYHAGMTPESRAELHLAYLADTVPVLVATTAFGMGVDKPNVRAVVHYHVPSGIEGYLQESGRGGRDGAEAYSLVLADADDLLPLRNRFQALKPTQNALDSFLRSLLPGKLSGVRYFSAWDVQALYDLDETVLSRALVYLEEQGYLRWVGNGKKKWKLRPLVPPAVLMSGRSEEERLWLEWLVEHRELTLDEVVERMDWSYAEALSHLSELELSGEWRVQATHQIRLLEGGKPVPSYSGLAGELYSLFERRIEGDLARLEGVWHFLGESRCYNQLLEEYFGEEASVPCGKCTSCLSGAVVLNDASEEPSLDTEDIAFIRELADKKYPSLGSSRKMARFLAGFLSPSASRARLWKLPHYGAYPACSLSSLEMYCSSVM